MIISKDLFIFGEQIFSTIIPEGEVEGQQDNHQPAPLQSDIKSESSESSQTLPAVATTLPSCTDNCKTIKAKTYSVEAEVEKNKIYKASVKENAAIKDLQQETSKIISTALAADTQHKAKSKYPSTSATYALKPKINYSVTGSMGPTLHENGDNCKRNAASNHKKDKYKIVSTNHGEMRAFLPDSEQSFVPNKNDNICSIEAQITPIMHNNENRENKTIGAFRKEHNHTIHLSFENVTVVHNGRKILLDVSGIVSPGEILAIMGPSGSGKTTLLDSLSGQRHIDGGCIYLNREPLSKKWRRRICYVLQEEVFFTGLTLRETVMYTAFLRLPENMDKTEKIQKVDRICETLELNCCQETKIGDYLNRGLSGGEKKRANIACELLTNPVLMLLDEPTSGLDSHAAISLMKVLKRYAKQEQKTVVTTVHQPSSQMFHMFDKLLLLYNGQTAYFGEVKNIFSYFEKIGVTIKPHYNPADFVLEQLKSCPDIREKLFIVAKESHGNFINRNSLHNFQGSSDKDIQQRKEKSKPSALNFNNIINNYYSCRNIAHGADDVMNNDVMLIMREDPSNKLMWCGVDSQSNSNFSSVSSECYSFCEDDTAYWLDYPTRFYTQFCVLSSRNFKEAKSRMLSKLNWFQTIGLALMAGAIWFQIPRTEEFLHDLQGWMFFSQTYWMLFALFGALNSFPAEREVISKERRSGAYRLSAYYLAKMIGELPLVITLPTVYLAISYPMLGCASLKLFVLMLVFLLINTIVAQSVGFFIGASCMDMNMSITLSALYTLATQLFGGYLSSRIPEGLSWIRYISMIHYAYHNMQILEFSEGPPIRCGNPSSYEICKNNSTLFIPSHEILAAQSSSSPLWFNTFVLLTFFVVFRGLGYAVLRYLHCPKK